MNFPMFMLGLGIGLISSVIGALLQHRFSVEKEQSAKLPNLIFPVTGILGFIGLAAIIISLFTGWVAHMIAIGFGVVAGFFVGFCGMLILTRIIRR